MQEFINIPEERKAVLIGKNGETKNRIEKATKTKIFVKEDVEIDGEPLDSLKAKEIVQAIGRGFSPEISLGLLKEDTALLITKITGSEKTIKRKLARVIGSHGKARKNIEFLTNTHISVYGKTISVIGKYEDAMNAKNAIDSLLSGSMHGYIYKNLERIKSKKTEKI